MSLGLRNVPQKLLALSRWLEPSLADRVFPLSVLEIPPRLELTGENRENGGNGAFRLPSKRGISMHTLFSSANRITHAVIGSAIEVHKEKGPGLLESIYEWCLTMELQSCGFAVQNQAKVIVRWKQFEREYPLRFDVLVNQCLLVEVKAVETVHPINKAQLLSYMKILDIPLGLIINFNELKLTDGVSRLILPGANGQ